GGGLRRVPRVEEAALPPLERRLVDEVEEVDGRDVRVAERVVDELRVPLRLVGLRARRAADAVGVLGSRVPGAARRVGLDPDLVQTQLEAAGADRRFRRAP